MGARGTTAYPFARAGVLHHHAFLCCPSSILKRESQEKEGTLHKAGADEAVDVRLPRAGKFGMGTLPPKLSRQLSVSLSVFSKKHVDKLLKIALL